MGDGLVQEREGSDGEEGVRPPSPPSSPSISEGGPDRRQKKREKFLPGGNYSGEKLPWEKLLTKSGSSIFTPFFKAGSIIFPGVFKEKSISSTHTFIFASALRAEAG